ncbi:hypothetical protein ACFLYU_05105 [Candidatus Dependentiae bacterium]
MKRYISGFICAVLFLNTFSCFAMRGLIERKMYEHEKKKNLKQSGTKIKINKNKELELVLPFDGEQYVETSQLGKLPLDVFMNMILTFLDIKTLKKMRLSNKALKSKIDTFLNFIDLGDLSCFVNGLTKRIQGFPALKSDKIINLIKKIETKLERFSNRVLVMTKNKKDTKIKIFNKKTNVKNEVFDIFAKKLEAMTIKLKPSIYLKKSFYLHDFITKKIIVKICDSLESFFINNIFFRCCNQRILLTGAVSVFALGYHFSAIFLSKIIPLLGKLMLVYNGAYFIRLGGEKEWVEIINDPLVGVTSYSRNSNSMDDFLDKCCKKLLEKMCIIIDEHKEKEKLKKVIEENK